MSVSAPVGQLPGSLILDQERRRHSQESAKSGETLSEDLDVEVEEEEISEIEWESLLVSLMHGRLAPQTISHRLYQQDDLNLHDAKREAMTKLSTSRKRYLLSQSRLASQSAMPLQLLTTAAPTTSVSMSSGTRGSSGRGDLLPQLTGGSTTSSAGLPDAAIGALGCVRSTFIGMDHCL